MKRIITLFLSLTLLALSATMLYGCGDSETPPSSNPNTVSSTQGDTNNSQNNHTHTFATNWTQAEGGHYRACACHPDEKVLSPHADSVDRDGKCDVCFFVMSEPKVYTVTTITESGMPLQGVEIKIFDSSFEKIVTTDENGQCSAFIVYPGKVKAIVQSAPNGYESIVNELYIFDGYELSITVQRNY